MLEESKQKIGRETVMTALDQSELHFVWSIFIGSLHTDTAQHTQAHVADVPECFSGQNAAM